MSGWRELSRGRRNCARDLTSGLKILYAVPSDPCIYTIRITELQTEVKEATAYLSSAARSFTRKNSQRFFRMKAVDRLLHPSRNEITIK
jgi:hypothetical protein